MSTSLPSSVDASGIAWIRASFASDAATTACGAPVEVDGALKLEAGLIDPQPVAGKDVNHAGHLNLARIVNERGEAAPTLVQAGPVLAFSSSDRGKPQVTAFDSKAIGLDAAVLADLGVHRLVRLQVQSRHVPVRSEPSRGRSQHDPRRSVARRLTTGSRRSR